MSYHHCSNCGEDAEEDEMSVGCSDRSCCSPSYLLTCHCEGRAFVCVGDDCDEEHREEYRRAHGAKEIAT